MTVVFRSPGEAGVLEHAINTFRFFLQYDDKGSDMSEPLDSIYFHLIKRCHQNADYITASFFLVHERELGS